MWRTGDDRRRYRLQLIGYGLSRRRAQYVHTHIKRFTKRTETRVQRGAGAGADAEFT